jgi:valine--pyruvate aminotransferase
MLFSRFGQKLSGDAGIVSLMDDLGDALRTNPDLIFMGGGNPARIPEMEQAFAEALHHSLANPQQVHELLGVYQPPQGDVEVLDALADMLSNEYQWPITRDNIALSNGSQSAFFILFNMFAGEFEDGTQKQIQFPLAPEYLGYNDLGLSNDFFAATRPTIEILGDGFFKYRVDFTQLDLTNNTGDMAKSTGAFCVSRPTNPTGNVISDDELKHLDQLARSHKVPLIVDGAYGTPFPNILFVDVKPHWNTNTVLVLSLSKLGLPGVRTGIVIANPSVISAFAKANTVLNLACGNFGPVLVKNLLRSQKLLALSRNTIAPFYRQRMEQTVAIFKRHFNGLPYLMHKPEGAIFLWFWFQNLPITSEELYRRLKVRGVLVISGHHFFPGLPEDWQHKHECIRVTYCQDIEMVERGATIIADELRGLFRQR